MLILSFATSETATSISSESECAQTLDSLEVSRNVAWMRIYAFILR